MTTNFPPHRIAQVADLIMYARNSRTHSDAQVAKIAASIKEFGFTNPVLTDGDNGIIAGHGRIMAAQKLGMKEVPIIELAHLSEAQRRAYIIADNRLALDAGWDEEMLRLEMDDLAELDYDLALTGFELEEIEGLGFDDDDEGLSDEYTAKIEAPIYEPDGHQPPLSECLDKTKAADLEKRINAQKGLHEDVREFLLAATKRHYKFRYDKIASYYAHAPAEIQELMEQSALVIIDYDKAVEEGYIKMNKALLELRNDSEA